MDTVYCSTFFVVSIFCLHLLFILVDVWYLNTIFFYIFYFSFFFVSCDASFHSWMCDFTQKSIKINTHIHKLWMNENSERRAYKHTQHTNKTKMHKICFENGIKQPNKITQFVHFGFVSGLSIYILSFLSVFASVGLLYRGQCNASHRQISKSLWICYDQHVLRHTNKYYFSTTTINGTIFKENGEFCAT